jgi:alanine dehydrogenase
MVRFYSEADVAGAVSITDALAAVEAGVAAVARGEAQSFVRRRHAWKGGRLHVLAAAWPARGVAGVKHYLSTRAAPGGGGFTYALHDAASGALVAVLDAERLGALRTGALSGVATARLARPAAAALALCGAGRQALTQLLAVCAVRPIRRVRVWSPSAARREAFVAGARGRLAPGVDLAAAAGVEEALDGADVVVTITSAAAPFLRATHLRLGMHVNAAGSNDPARAELAPDAVARAARVVVDARDVAEEESGDLIQARHAGLFRFADAVPLGALLVGQAEGRRGADEVTLFESQGVAIADLALAALVHERLGGSAGAAGGPAAAPVPEPGAKT